MAPQLSFTSQKAGFFIAASLAAGVCLGTMLVPARDALVAAQSKQPPAPAQGATTPVATVEGQPITEAELDNALGTSLSKLEEDLYNLRRERLEEMIADKLLQAEATRRGMDVAKLVETEINAKIMPVTEQDVDSFFEANKARLPTDRPDLKDQIRRYLESQRVQGRRQAYLDELRKGKKVEVLLPRPPIRRAQVNIEGAPVRGNPAAPVTVVEFSDFHCPFCKRVQPTLLDLLKRYPDKVRLVYKDLPLDSLHPNARKASEAARCARDQGKFWEYHDMVYAGGTDVSPDYLKKLATDVGIDPTAFEACLASGKHEAGIQRDQQEAAQLGLSGTPGFFINGRALSGAQPLEAFIRVIDEELQGVPGQ